MSDWKETARQIAEEAWQLCGNNEQKALGVIHIMARDCNEISDLSTAYRLINDVGDTDINIFCIAYDEFVKRKWDKIRYNETIDNAILRLAYLIIKTKAEEEYNKIFIEERKISI